MAGYKKHMAAFFLLALIAVPVFFSVIFIYEQALVHQKSQSLLKQSKLITLTVAAEDITWVEKGKEVMIKDRFFDVASYSIQNSAITLTGVFDQDEDALMEELKWCNDVQNESPSPFAVLVLKFVAENTFITADEIFTCAFMPGTVNSLFASYDEAAHSIAATPPIQPPRSCC